LAFVARLNIRSGGSCCIIFMIPSRRWNISKRCFIFRNKGRITLADSVTVLGRFSRGCWERINPKPLPSAMIGILPLTDLIPMQSMLTRLGIPYLVKINIQANEHIWFTPSSLTVNYNNSILRFAMQLEKIER